MSTSYSAAVKRTVARGMGAWSPLTATRNPPARRPVAVNVINHTTRRCCDGPNSCADHRPYGTRDKSSRCSANGGPGRLLAR